MYLGFAVTGILNIAVVAILARQLTPAEFGIVAMAKVSLSLLTVIGAEGVNEFVIYDRQDDSDLNAKAAFWMDMSLAALSCLIGFFFLQPITNFYNEPQLYWVLFALLIKYFLDTLSKVPDALLKRQLLFKKIEIRNTILSLFSGLLSIVMAFLDYGVWSLVIPKLISAPIKAAFTFSMVNWNPGFWPLFNRWKRIFKYSSHVIGNTITTFFLREGDTLLIGKFLGSSALGVYNLAWQGANLFVGITTGVVNKVALPTLSTISGDLNKVKSGLVRMMRVISIMTFPIFIILFVLAEEFVFTLYGPNWSDSVIILRILIIYAIRFSVGSPAGVVFKAIGRPDVSFKLGLVILPFYIAGIYLGSHYGIIGVAIGVTFVRTVFGFITFGVLAKVLKTTYSEIMRPLYPSFMVAVITGLIIWALKLVIGNYVDLKPMISLLLFGSLSVFVFVGLVRVYFQSIGSELVNLVKPVAGKYTCRSSA